MADHDALVKAWETYQKHHHKGTAYDYAAFSDALRPFVSKVESDFDALAAELAAVTAKAERLRRVAEKAGDVLRYDIYWEDGSQGDEDWADLASAYDLLHEGDLAVPDAPDPRCDSCDAPGATHIVPGESLINGLMTLCTECFEAGLAARDAEGESK